MRYLADTNTLIAWMVRRDAAVERRMTAERRRTALSVIVQFELFFGAFNSAHVERNLAVIAQIDLPVLPFESEDARAAGHIRATLRRLGQPIGPYDTLIAGHAVARDLVLITNNTREFERVEGLRVEDWTLAP